MLLGRLRVRQKLVLLVLPLLVLLVLGAVPLVAGRMQAADRSANDVQVVERAVRIGELIQELQQERLSSLGYLSGAVNRDRVVARSARVLELAQQLYADYGGDDQLASVLRGVSYRSGLDGIRIQVLGGRATGVAVYSGFTEAISGLLDALRLPEHADRTTAAGRQQLALDSIIRHDEATAAAGAALFTEAGRRVTVRVISLVSAGRAIEDREETTFLSLADPSTVELYEQVEEGQSSTRLTGYLESLTESPARVLDDVVAPDLLPRVESLTSLSRLVGTRVAGQAVDEANSSAARERALAGVGLAIALFVLLCAVVLSVFITRSISRPLRRLTASADEVADVAQQELVRVADSDDPQTATPRLRPVRVGTSDELGELAQAFNRVQQVAADLVERQLVSRRNVATMFGNVGRRTQNLVGRQLAMIDSLERNEQDPALLDRLYRLDHVSTRLRRNANSLVVLSGATDAQITGEPLSVADTIRSALGEIEGFQRVRLGEVDSATLTPQVTPDVILLLAELLENGTSFSPPHTEVEVDARVLADGGVLVRIVDHGLGMTAEQLSAENARLVERERLDLAPTDVLGLFVVGRLARRHGIEVMLAPTPGTGITAEVRVPERHVMHAERPPAPSRPVVAGKPGAAPAHAGGAGPEPNGAANGTGTTTGTANGTADTAPSAAPDRAARPEVAQLPARAAGPAPSRGRDDDGSSRGWWEPVLARPDTHASAEAAGAPSRPVGRAGAPPASPPAAPAQAPGPLPGSRRVPGTRPIAPAAGGPAAAGASRAEWPPAAGASRLGGTAAMPPVSGSGGGSNHTGPAGPGQDRPAPPTEEQAQDPDRPAGIAGGRPESGDPPGAAAAAAAPGSPGQPGPGGDAPAGPGAESRDPDRPGPVAGDIAGDVAGDAAGDIARDIEVDRTVGMDGRATGGTPEPAVAPPPGAAGMVRRVRGAQLPDLGGPHRPEPASPPSPEEARQAIEDFEAGVQQALRDTGTAAGAGLDTSALDARVPDPAPAPWTGQERDEPPSAEQARALEEFEDGVRRALARLDELAARPAPEPAPLFERRPATEPVEPPPPADRRTTGPDGDRPGRPAQEPLPPRRLDAGATRADTVLPLFPAHPDPRPLERRRAPDGRPAGADDPGAGDPVAAFGPGAPVPPEPPEGRPAADRWPAPAPDPGQARPGGGPALPDEPAAAATGNGDRPPVEPAHPKAGGPQGGLQEDGHGGPPASANLIRRVPGAQLPAGARAARPGTPAAPGQPDAAEQDAAAARALVEEFEAGVQRALHDGGDRGTAGTGEEGVR